MKSHLNKKLAVLTSGGDAPGMNAAVRSVVRAGLYRGIGMYAVMEGYQGMVDGGDRICAMGWTDVGGILRQGGTMIGTARCQAFREREGRLKAAENLVKKGIDGLVVVGGDGSLTGADLFRREWSGLLEELLSMGRIDQQQVSAHPALAIVGLVGSIDNDMFGTDMTIGADTALHRVTEAIDAITSTAASHQRTFIVEVMGRNCGYLALMGGLATAADWLLIPESPPATENWRQVMCDALAEGRKAGRRDSIVVLAEGARDDAGQPITSDMIRQVLKDQLHWDVRTTVLGHVQRGGMTSAFDRNMASLLGFAAVEELLSGAAVKEPQLIGLSGNRISRKPLMDCVRATQSVAEAVVAHRYDRAMTLRGGSFREAFSLFCTLARSHPHDRPGQSCYRLAVMNAGGLAPGMNTATRIAVRMGLDLGHQVMVVDGGFPGLRDGRLRPADWSTVAGWAGRGGSELGTSRWCPEQDSDLKTIADVLQDNGIGGVLMIGGWDGYRGIQKLYHGRERFAGLQIPMLCLPASIDNNLPGSELSIGADTALNNIVAALDKIRQSAVATSRVFVVEVMGANCGYLALMSGLASGAERIYLHEEGVSLAELQQDVERLKADFSAGKRLGLVIRNEGVNDTYDSRFMNALFAEEGKGLFQSRTSILGHVQQGGDPSPFDRIQATRLADHAMRWLASWVEQGRNACGAIGLNQGGVQFLAMDQLIEMTDQKNRRPLQQWWMELRDVVTILSRCHAGEGKDLPITRRLLRLSNDILPD